MNADGTTNKKCNCIMRSIQRKTMEAILKEEDEKIWTELKNIEGVKEKL